MGLSGLGCGFVCFFVWLEVVILEVVSLKKVIYGSFDVLVLLGLHFNRAYNCCLSTCLLAGK